MKVLTVDVTAEGDHTIKGREDPRWAPLREAVAELLPQVDGVLALRQAHGEVAPHLFRGEEELDDLALWPKYPLPDTARLIYEAHPEARLGIVCRGCEERGLIEMAKHQQVEWDRLVLIGLNCTAEEAQACRCANPTTARAQRVVGQPAEGVEDALVADFLAMSVEERQAFWQHYLERCIKCYACRNACPQCFCHACALEENLWVESGRLPPPFPTFHLIKAMHMAGKCVACRECEMTCPAEIPLTIFYRLINRDVEELFGYQPGADLEIMPPLLLALEGEA